MNFLLPFNNVIDLAVSYKKILSVQLLVQQTLIEQLEANNIPYKVIEPVGLLIDKATIPDDVHIDFNKGKEEIKFVYDELMVISYDEVKSLL